MTALLQATLEVAVPLWMVRVQADPFPDDEGRHRLVDAIASNGDILQFGGKRKGETAQVFNALAEALARLAFIPGGVTAFGMHFCVDHAGHQAASEGVAREV